MLMGKSVYVIILTEQLTDIVKGKNVHVALDVSMVRLWSWLLFESVALRFQKGIVRCPPEPGVAAVALDHFNDVLSNLVAIAVLAAWWRPTPLILGVIAISLYIAYSWLETSIEQVQHLVGWTADPGSSKNWERRPRPTPRGCSATSRRPTSGRHRGWTMVESLRLYACRTI